MGINGTSENDNLVGTPENDRIFGDLGDDTLDGKGGADEFVFNDVNDILIDQVTGDVTKLYVYSTDGFDIVENLDGADNIITIDSETQNSENLNIEMGSVAAVSSSGPSKKTKYIFGTKGSDTINGTSANDIIRSLSGDDIVYGNEGHNELYGGTGDDSLYGGAEFNELHGGEGKDYLNGGGYGSKLYGGAGNDTLDGRDSSGNTLMGATGNDTYIVDVKNDSIMLEESEVDDASIVNDAAIIEYSDEGTDTVETTVSYILGDNLENLLLAGSNDINGIGNALDNQIDGNTGKNFLVGGKGNDKLKGYKDDDILVGEAGSDTLIGGAGNDFLEGVSGKDILIGGSGKDFLNGGSGKDTLTGGSGADTFVLSSPSDEVDKIKDFNSKEGDKIQISASKFGIELDDYDSFIFNSSTNELFLEQVVVGENTASSSLSPLVSLQPGSNFNPSLDINIV